MHGINRIRKAAILLLSLPEAQAVDLLARLEPRHAALVAGEIAKNQAVSDIEQHQVLLEFAGINPVALTQPRGGKQVAEKLLIKARQAPQGTLARLRRIVAPRPLAFLRHVEANRLAALLAEESPQTVAVVASRLPPPRAAAMLALLDSELREAVIRRVTTLGRIDTAVMREVAHVLRWRLLTNRERSLRADSAHLPPLGVSLAGPHF